MISGKTALFGVVIAVAAGLFGTNIAQIHDDSQKIITNSLTGGAPILGHVELVKRDSNGNIVAYRQGDNIIVNMGLNCMAYALFRTVATSSLTDPVVCGAGIASAGTLTAAFDTSSGFRYIQIGTSALSGIATVATLTSLNGALGTFQTGGIIFTPVGSATTATVAGGGPAVSISSTSSFTVSGPLTIVEAGLFDRSVAGGNMFARQTFPAITMSTGDTLAVTWTITLAHG